KKPLPEENVNDAILECLLNPPLYKKIINEFREKQLPSEKGLANLLDRNYGIKGNAANVAARIFIKNLQGLSLIAPGNILKLDSYIPYVEEKSEVSNTTEEDPELENVETVMQLPVRAENKQEKPGKRIREIPVYLQGEEREAKLVLPMDFTEDDLKR